MPRRLRRSNMQTLRAAEVAGKLIWAVDCVESLESSWEFASSSDVANGRSETNMPVPSRQDGRFVAGFKLAWMFVALLGVGLGWVYVESFRVEPESTDRALILLAAAWLCYRQRSVFIAETGSPSILGLILVAQAAVFLPTGSYLFAQVGPRHPLLWWLTCSWLTAVAGLVLTEFGSKGLRALAFPLAFVVFALPVPHQINQPLQKLLHEATTSTATAVLPFLGVPVERTGFVLRLASGDLGVVEACSGVKSVTAIAAVAALIASIRGFGWLRGLTLFGLALPVIALANAARVILSGVLQEQFGNWMNQGAAHEAIGVFTLIVGLAAVLGLSEILRPRLPKSAKMASDPAEPRKPAHGGWLVAGLLGCTSFASVAAAGAIIITRSGDDGPTVSWDAISMQIGQWSGADVPADAAVLELLSCDHVRQLSYRNVAGQRVLVWLMFWSPSNVAMDTFHHPEGCWPLQGWTRLATGRKAVSLADDVALSYGYSRFQLGKRQQLICYWFQEGFRVLDEQQEQDARMNRRGYSWVLRRLGGSSALNESPLIAVCVGAESWEWSGYAEQAMSDFLRDLANEVYRVCPWARPLTNKSAE